jgi:hypothetical protein
VAAAVHLAPLGDRLMPRNLPFPVGLAHAEDGCLLPDAETIALINANLTTVITTIASLLPKLIESD